MRRCFWVLLALLSLRLALYGQTERGELKDSLLTPGMGALPDTALEVQTASPMTMSATEGDTLPQAFPPSKSPTLAMALSALLPGGGQVYNGSYWKVPIVVGFGVYFLSQWLDQNRRYLDSRDKYQQSLVANPNGDQLELARREFYKDQRDTYTWYLAIVYVLNIADAYVDASLYDFNVSGNLSIRFLPAAEPGVRVHISF